MFFDHNLMRSEARYRLSMCVTLNPANALLRDEALYNRLTGPMLGMFRAHPWEVLLTEPTLDNAVRYFLNMWNRAVGGDITDIAIEYGRRDGSSFMKSLSATTPADIAWFSGVDSGWMPPSYEQHVGRWQADGRAVAEPYFKEAHALLRESRRDTANVINEIRKISNSGNGGALIIE